MIPKGPCLDAKLTLEKSRASKQVGYTILQRRDEEVLLEPDSPCQPT
jgi:hypothetical protein